MLNVINGLRVIAISNWLNALAPVLSLSLFLEDQPPANPCRVYVRGVNVDLSLKGTQRALRHTGFYWPLNVSFEGGTNAIVLFLTKRRSVRKPRPIAWLGFFSGRDC